MPFGFGRGRGGWGRGRSFGGGRNRWFRPWGPVGPVETCICPNCGTVISHQRGVPCFQTKCPNCGSPMARQFFP